VFRSVWIFLLGCSVLPAFAQQLPGKAGAAPLVLADLLGADAGFTDPLAHPFMNRPRGEGSPAPAPAATFRLNQSFRQPFSAGGSSLTLGPSASITLHDPLRETEGRLEELRSQLETLELQREAAANLLAIHRNAATVQNLLVVGELAGLYLQAAAPLLTEAAAAPGFEQAVHDPAAWRLREDSLDYRELLKQAQAGIQLFSLALESATGLPAGSFRSLTGVQRPVLQIAEGTDLLAACLAGSNQLQRLELWQEQDALEARQRELRLQPSVRLDLGAQLSVDNLPAEPRLGVSWSLGLHVAAPRLADASFDLDLNRSGVTQRSSFVWPRRARTEAAGQVDHAATSGSVLLSLIQLLDQLESAGRATSRYRLQAAGAYDLLVLAAGPGLQEHLDAQLLTGALASALTLLQAQLELDSTVLELAAACRLPVSYEAGSYLP
jgi:hypothetical protein